MAGSTVVSSSLTWAAAVRVWYSCAAWATSGASRAATSSRLRSLRAADLARTVIETKQIRLTRSSRPRTARITYMRIRFRSMADRGNASVRGNPYATRLQQPQQPHWPHDGRTEILAALPELPVRGHYQAALSGRDSLGHHAHDRVVARARGGHDPHAAGSHLAGRARLAGQYGRRLPGPALHHQH